MITILVLTSLLAYATSTPISESFGPVTPPSLVGDILFGRQVQCDCTGIMQRTLFDIVRSCLLTIAACVYRAIHQNIPDPNATSGQRMWVRIKITVMALFAPEMMIWWAMKQWMAARMIRNRVNREYPGLQWTLTHGHFLQMGGLVRKDNGSVVLLDTLLHLLHTRHVDVSNLRKVTTKEIDDHSKGDFLSKAVVTLQTTWFVVECITRWQQKLLLTELEVVTLAFAVLNVFTYGLWWHKPLDVLCPIQLDIHVTPIAPQLSANPNEREGSNGGVYGEETRFLLGPSADRTPTVGVASRVSASLSTLARDVKAAFREWKSGMAVEFKRGWTDGILAAVWLPIEGLFNRFKALFEIGVIDPDATHVPTFYAAELGGLDWYIVLYVCCFIGMIFGGVHFLSWDSHFPTHIELLLWRISSVILVAEPFSIALLTLVITNALNWNIPETLVVVFGLFSSIIGPVAYVLARSCLLVLAFLSLHNLPARVFETISWTNYIPHL